MKEILVLTGIGLFGFLTAIAIAQLPLLVAVPAVLLVFLLARS